METPELHRRLSKKSQEKYQEIINRRGEFFEIGSFKKHLEERILILEDDPGTEPDHLKILQKLKECFARILELEQQINQLSIWKNGSLLVSMMKDHLPRREVKDLKNKEQVELLSAEKEHTTDAVGHLMKKLSEDYPGEFLMFQEHINRVITQDTTSLN
jgi:hypothetical protein